MSSHDEVGPSIDDPWILGIPVEGSAEPLLDAAEVLAVRPRVGQRLEAGPACTLVRTEVAERLCLADQALGELRLAVVEGYRSPERQQAEFELECARLAAIHPSWSPDRVSAETARFVAPPDPRAPHASGGAVDIVLVDAHGALVDVGCPVNGFETREVCPTYCPGLTPVQRLRRRRLVAAMTSVGLVNYSHEWWHWSYGDRYWAWRTGAGRAIYDAVDPAPRAGTRSDPAGVSGPARVRAGRHDHRMGPGGRT